jgi:hypothetical protein
MDKTQALDRLPHLASPAALAIADSGGRWSPAPHLMAINNALVRAWRTPNSRLAVSVPFQHGKTVLCSNYFPAWVLLLWPETRIFFLNLAILFFELSAWALRCFSQYDLHTVGLPQVWHFPSDTILF